MVPNLDRMKRQQLLEFWKKYNRPSRNDAAELVGDREPGYVRDARQLANYASNRAAQLYCRGYNDNQGCRIYWKICDDILNELPLHRTWLR